MTFHSSFLPRSLSAACALAAALCLGGSAEAQNPQCATPYKAAMKMWETPWHLSMIDSTDIVERLHGGKPKVAEEIFVNGVVYVNVKGAWRKSPVDVAAMKKEGAEHMAGDKATCAHVRDESVVGEGAALWSIHSVTEDGTSDSQLWISKSRGTVLKMDTRMDVGGSMGKSHSVGVYNYANVQAPAGAQ